jgi:hypothetical protein
MSYQEISPLCRSIIYNDDFVWIDIPSFCLPIFVSHLFEKKKRWFYFMPTTEYAIGSHVQWFALIN